MGRAWIEDEKRPGGIGRSERERVFWERVASGRKPAAVRGLRRSRRKLGSTAVQLTESLEMAIVTMLTVVVFGLGWATLETERFAAAGNSNSDVMAPQTGYALPTSAVEEIGRD